MFFKNYKQKKNIEFYLSQEEINELNLYIKSLNMLDIYTTHNFVHNNNELNVFLSKLEKSFSPCLIDLISKSGKTEVEIYKKANIDRKLFSKIKKNNNYHPSKNTVIALVLSLELSIDDAFNLLATAGYTLSPSIKKDLIITYFIEKKIYNVNLLNLVLDEHDLDLI